MANSIINSQSNQMFTVKNNGITILGRTRVYDTYQLMISDKHPSDFAWCIDASEDPTVNTGSAFYYYKNGKWQKLYESEAMDNELSFKPEGYDELVVTVNNLKNIVESGTPSGAINDHLNDQSIHVSSSDRVLWNTVSNKVDIVEGKGLSTNDFTDDDKNKLHSIENYNDSEIRASITETNNELSNTKTILESFIAEQLIINSALEELNQI